MRQNRNLLATRMSMVLAALVVCALGLGLSPRDAHADDNAATSKKLRAKVAKAMEAFDGFEYEQARQILNSALLLAKKKRVTKDKALAQVHLSLGIVYFAGFEEPESAKLAFLEALSIDPKLQIAESYKTKEMEELLDAVRVELGGDDGGDGGDGDGGDGEPVDDINCDELEGVKHTLVDEATSGSDTPISAHVSPALDASKVVLYYRPKGATDFKAARMKKSGECKFTATIPGAAVADEFVHYYVAAEDEDGKTIASRGSAGSPNIIEITGEGGGDGDNPLDDGKNEDDGKSGSDGAKHDRVFISIAIGSGGGYVTGDTEQVKSPVQCCFAPALLHLFPEIGFYFSAQTSVSLAFRMGFPVGANRDKHATAAPGGFIRLRHALSSSGEGVHVSGLLGGGILRHTVKLTDVPAGDGDVDTVASGPLFVGTGLGYTTSLGGPIKLIVDLNMFAAIPVTTIGDIDPGFALQFDGNIGLLFSF